MKRDAPFGPQTFTHFKVTRELYETLKLYDHEMSRALLFDAVAYALDGKAPSYKINSSEPDERMYAAAWIAIKASIDRTATAVSMGRRGGKRRAQNLSDESSTLEGVLKGS